MFDRTLQDLRFAVRQPAQSKGFTLTAVLTLALGIGANTAIFTLVHAVMLRSLPVADPQQLFRLGTARQQHQSGTGSPHIVRCRTMPLRPATPTAGTRRISWIPCARL